jgi:hypothetical protein
MHGTFAKWTDREGWTAEQVPLTQPMLVIGYDTVLQKWKDGVAEVKTGHPLPDPNELNAKIPTSEWELDLTGKPTPPWKITYAVYMVDAAITGAIFTYANSTFGAKIMYERLEEQIAVVRLLRGEEDVFPIVSLEKRPMPTRYGLKTRPHLQPIDWRAPGRGSKPTPVTPQTPQIGGPTTPTTASTPTTPTTPAASGTPPVAPAAATASSILDHTQPVKPVTVAELIADELPPWA